MISYLPLLEAALKKRNIRYSLNNDLIVFTRGYSNGKMKVRVKFALLLFPADIDVVALVDHPLESEQMVKARLLLEKSNKTIFNGEVDCNHPSHCLRYVGTFDPLNGPEWCEEAREQMQEFIVEYTSGIVPEILLDIFIRAVDSSFQVPEDDAAVESPGGGQPGKDDTSEITVDDEESFRRLWQRITEMEAANRQNGETFTAT
jgi:hypothetical protein